MDDHPWAHEEIIHLHQQVYDELRVLFQHDAMQSAKLLSEWLAMRPHASPDFISHLGPFNVALSVHYDLIEQGDSSSAAFIRWRKQFHQVWEDRRKPTLKPAQEALLRSRGWTGN